MGKGLPKKRKHGADMDLDNSFLATVPENGLWEPARREHKPRERPASCASGVATHTRALGRSAGLLRAACCGVRVHFPSMFEIYAL